MIDVRYRGPPVAWSPSTPGSSLCWCGTWVSRVRLRVSRRDILLQLDIIGIHSIMIVLITAALIGVVTSQQGGYQMQSQNPALRYGDVPPVTVRLPMLDWIRGNAREAVGSDTCPR